MFSIFILLSFDIGKRVRTTRNRNPNPKPNLLLKYRRLRADPLGRRSRSFVEVIAWPRPPVFGIAVAVAVALQCSIVIAVEQMGNAVQLRVV